MNLYRKTPPTIEPISLLEVKQFLHLDVATGANGVNTLQTLAPDSRNSGVYSGDAIEVLGYLATISLSCAGVLGTLDVKVQESNDNATWNDFYSFAQVSAANDDQVYSYNYTGSKRYVRAVSTVTSAAASFSVEVQSQVGDTAEDAFLTSIITAAREYCEDYQNRAYITQTWVQTFDYWPSFILELPKGNLQKINSITYKNSAGTVKTLTENTDFVVSLGGIIGRVSPAWGRIWPAFTPFPLDAVTIDFDCGYGDTSGDVPLKVVHAMRLLISHWYELRAIQPEARIVPKEIDFSISALLGQDKIPHIQYENGGDYRCNRVY